jgi:hypothetical protein
LKYGRFYANKLVAKDETRSGTVLTYTTMSGVVLALVTGFMQDAYGISPAKRAVKHLSNLPAISHIPRKTI